LKKILLIKAVVICVVIGFLLALIIGVVTAVTGISIGYDTVYNESTQIYRSSFVANNQLYAARYRTILNKYLIEKGYVSLERLVFYLQRTNNVLDITTLSNEVWEEAYLKNLNEEYKRMIPIKTLCNELNNDITLPEYTIKNDTNNNGVLINALNLCVIDGVDITKSDDYLEGYFHLPYAFPLENNFTVTSIVFENRNIEFDLSNEALTSVNYHSGWDFATTIGTDFYSICDGKITKLVNTQFNDLPYNSSGNAIGNYIEVECDNGLIAQYYHIKADSTPFHVDDFVNINQLLGKTSTTGLSTGPHLHVELKDKNGNLLDVLDYIDFDYKK